jgi:23S rRNA (pseudouridine1915-N3)-methyltransferase
MKIKIIIVGKTKVDYLRAGEKDYLHRLRRDCQMEIVEIKEEPITKNKDAKTIKETEGKRIIEKLDLEFFNIILDREGKSFNSEEFARMIKEKRDYSGARICFIIGGPLGLSSEVLSKANLTLSFSKLTFTHEMIRLLLLEQLYRAFEIIRGSSYHK